MAKLLFGGPQEIERGSPNNIHDELVSRLRTEGYEVNYLTRGDDMFGALQSTKISRTLGDDVASADKYDLVIYDTGLFYDQADLSFRSNIYKDNVVDILKTPELPVIVLAGPEISELIKDVSKEAGFYQINQPYNIDDVVGKVSSLV